ncbi:WhiB family transcriptional regulator [Bifidobacterium tissieri]|uniref:WhiB family transcriptional regulator n=1 Tax=Bifidobacterium tissieri TaxID=1630162 RepID=UPI001CC2CA0B|nr:WhiB family transcriptional regulator [Bifidobacterium tissieri]
MWGVFGDSQKGDDSDSATQESAERALFELWGLFDTNEDVSWQHKALCAQTDPEAFFPEKGGSTRDAKRVCAQCEVREQCLKWAIDHDERFGIWGGMSERERRRYKKEHGKEQA